MTQTETPEKSPATGARSGLAGVLKIMMIVAIALGLGLLFWFLPFSNAIVGDAHKRNQRDLAIAASGLETWSDAVKTIAVTNFIRGRVGDIEPGDRDGADQWTHRARFRHPVLGEYKMLYRVGTDADCARLAEIVTAKEGPLPFVRNYFVGGGSMLKVIDRFSVGDIWRHDQLQQPGDLTAGPGTALAPDAAAYLANILNIKTNTPAYRPLAPAGAAGDIKVCYGAVISLDRLLVIDRAARDFSNLLVVDSGRRIVAQIGAEPIPLQSLDGLAANSSVVVDTLAATVGKSPGQPRQTALVDSLDPVELTVGGKAMVAYIRPFHPPVDSFPACKPVSKPPDLPRLSLAVSTEDAATSASAAAPEKPAKAINAKPPPVGGQCFVVGLMPKVAVWRKLASPPLPLVIGLGLAIGIALTLMPSLRLLLLGPREALGRAEVIGVALGVPAAASLAALVLLFAGDLTAHRNVAAKTATGIATQAASDSGQYLARAAARAAAVSDTIITGGKLTIAAQAGLEAAINAGQDAKAWPTLPEYAAHCVAQGMDGTRNSDSYVTVGTDLAVNPRPLRCTRAPICTDATPGDESRPPLIESIGHYGFKGTTVPGTRTTACRSFFGGRAQVLGRDYFQRALANDPTLGDGEIPQAGGPPRLYMLEQVLAQPDGISKTIIALRARQPGWYTTPDTQDRAVHAIATTVITDLVTPAVLPPYHMMVVDTRDPRLPVIMHPTPNRSGAERLVNMLDRPDEIRDRLRGLAVPGNPARTIGFTRFYDGADRHFVAAPIKGSRWVVLVHYADADIDVIPSRTARYALTNWAAMSVLFVAGWIGWLVTVGQRGRVHAASPVAPRAPESLAARARHGLGVMFDTGWPRLWPQEARRGDYDWLTRHLLIGAGMALAAMLAIMALGWPSLLVFLGALATRAGAGLLLHWRLGQPAPTVAAKAPADPISTPDPSDHAMRPITQASFLRLACALVLCLSIVPMLGFWWDARTLSHREASQQLLVAIDGRDGVAAEANRGLERIWWTLGKSPGSKRQPARAFGFGYDPAAAPQSTSALPPFIATIFAISQRDGHDVAVAGCTPGTGGAARLCGSPGPGRGIDVASPSPRDIGGTAWFFLILAALALGGALFSVLQRILGALCGFGIALEAVAYPRLYLGSLWTGRPLPPRVDTEKHEDLTNIQTLNRKSLLVNAPWSIRPMLELLCDEGGSTYARARSLNRIIKTVDLSGLQVGDNEALPDIEVAAGQIILVVGLDLVLADARRRLMALATLEVLVKKVDALTTEGPIVTGTDGEDVDLSLIRDPYLLFLAPATPMDRILDAYEREHADAVGLDSKRENMRWARLFEDFATFQFRPIELTDGKLPDAVKTADVHQAKAIRTVFEELRWMSPRVVNGCINDELYPRAPLLRRGLLPVRDPATPGESPFIDLYRQPTLDWALARRFPGRNAALSYIRGQFIEHYQRLWSSSTRAERLVMHHLAFGRFVNIQTSLGFGSLVRRGLVVLDPDPRLMNESFAMFVRQAEKLDRIKEWQGSLPGSVWLKSRLPIFVLLGLAIAALAAMATLAGQDFLTLLPVLAAGAPALIAATQRLFKPA